MNICQKTLKSVGDILNFGTCTLLKAVIPLLFALATVAFIWGVIQMFINPDNEEAKKKGKSYMMWGIIALFVMLSVWGLVAIISNTFNLGTPVIPQPSQVIE